MRWLLARVNGLGPHARAWHDETGGWGDLEHLVALLGDRIEDLRHTIVAASPVEFQPFEPRRVWRPNQTAPKPQGITMREFFEQVTHV